MTSWKWAWEGKVCYHRRTRSVYSVLYNFSFQGWATVNVESYPMFQQILQLPPSRWICIGSAFLEALYKAGSRQSVGCDKSDWQSGLLSNWWWTSGWEKEVMISFLRATRWEEKVIRKVLVTMWIKKGNNKTVSATMWRELFSSSNPCMQFQKSFHHLLP